MRIEERIELVEQMMEGNPTALSVSIPTLTVEILLDKCRERAALKKSELRWRTRANMYESSYRSVLAENKRLKQEVKRYGEALGSETVPGARNHRHAAQA